MSELFIYTIYKNPHDFPNKFVVRKFNLDVPLEPAVFIGDTLEEARNAIPPGLICMPRHAMDKPHIVECWI